MLAPSTRGLAAGAKIVGATTRRYASRRSQPSAYICKGRRHCVQLRCTKVFWTAAAAKVVDPRTTLVEATRDEQPTHLALRPNGPMGCERKSEQRATREPCRETSKFWVARDEQPDKQSCSHAGLFREALGRECASTLYMYLYVQLRCTKGSFGTLVDNPFAARTNTKDQVAAVRRTNTNCLTIPIIK